MQRVGLFYATREGQARRVAEHIATALARSGIEATVFDVKARESVAALERSEAIIIIGSVHMGKHEPELVKFVRAHRARLDAVPAAFLSVCGAESAAEHGATPEARAAATERVGEQLRAFGDATGWHPARVIPVAGALLYTHYNVLVRWMMKRIAEREALPTDTSRDYELTDWGALDDGARKIADELTVPSGARPLS